MGDGVSCDTDPSHALLSSINNNNISNMIQRLPGNKRTLVARQMWGSDRRRRESVAAMRIDVRAQNERPEAVVSSLCGPLHIQRKNVGH